MITDFVVVQQHPSMLSFVDSLQRKNAEALSFYPRQVFEREQEKGRLFLGLLNGEPCGYLYVGARGRTIRIGALSSRADACAPCSPHRRDGATSSGGRMTHDGRAP